MEYRPGWSRGKLGHESVGAADSGDLDLEFAE
jgi:hypothetical protein